VCWPGRALALLLTVVLFLFQAEQAAGGALERAMLGKSQIVDLTHTVGEGVFSPAGQERTRAENSGEGDPGSNSQRLPSPGELGTHLSLPANVLKGKLTVAKMPPRDLLAHAVVVDIAAKVAKAADYRATVQDLQAWERRNGRIPKESVVLFHTGWAGRWSDPARYLNLDAQGVARVPGISPGAAAFLVGEREIRGVGLDSYAPEVAPGPHVGEEATRQLFYAGKWQLSNLANLDRLPPKGTKLVVAPLRLDAGSAPARVIAILP
jgi:kynurenine formamidase